jgi:hypothetical protein
LIQDVAHDLHNGHSTLEARKRKHHLAFHRIVPLRLKLSVLLSNCFPVAREFI